MEERKTLKLSDVELKELEQLRAEKAERIAAEEKRAELEAKAATSVTINIPPAGGKSIKFGGREFLHGMTYPVSNDIKWGLEEIMNRLLAHESSLHESENKGRKQRRAYVQ